ncbi:MAG: asparagine synthase (glutamine-hydrolyzing) [bacterium]
MCGIAGILSCKKEPKHSLENMIKEMNKSQKHRGPDGEGIWGDKNNTLGLGHVRLSLIDIEKGDQPMEDEELVISYNGEIYNYIELRDILGKENFRTNSDTEVILKAYRKWGEKCVSHLRGMFAFAIWDKKKNYLFIARDRFGIKPFYYFIEDGRFYFASEVKALIPFKNNIEMDNNALKDYIYFQFYLGDKTLFKGVYQLLPAHSGFVKVEKGKIDISIKKYWEVYYNLDFTHKEEYFVKKVKELLFDSINIHLRSDVEIGSFISGGIDSGIIASTAKDIKNNSRFLGFTGKFSGEEEYDESKYARILAAHKDISLYEKDIKEKDFVDNIKKIIYSLDYPLAGPGSFPQFMVAKLASKFVKGILSGTGGDEIFGGYVRYLICYFEQCIKGAISGTLHSGKFIVTYESIIPNLKVLEQYKPLLENFWSDGVFDDRDKRYFRIVNRANGFEDEINWEILKHYSPFEEFKKLYWSNNVEKESYFDSMTHFDFKTLLPALLHVEDRVSMANGLEVRVPFLDHKLVELAATIPSDIKFKDGKLKRLLKIAFDKELPKEISLRKDKMGFPVPLNKWSKGPLKDFIFDIFTSSKAKHRHYLNEKFDIISFLNKGKEFDRKLWGLLSLELWNQLFIDDFKKYKS